MTLIANDQGFGAFDKATNLLQAKWSWYFMVPPRKVEPICSYFLLKLCNL